MTSPEFASWLSSTGFAGMVAREIVRSIRYRNGSSRRLEVAQVRLIVQEEIKPLTQKVDDIRTILAEAIGEARGRASQG